MTVPTRSTPVPGDLVVREDTRDGALVYVLSATPGAEQFLLHSREVAIAQARAFARRLGVHAWLADGNGFTVLDTPSRD